MVFLIDKFDGAARPGIFSSGRAVIMVSQSFLQVFGDAGIDGLIVADDHVYVPGTCRIFHGLFCRSVYRDQLDVEIKVFAG